MKITSQLWTMPILFFLFPVGCTRKNSEGDDTSKTEPVFSCAKEEYRGLVQEYCSNPITKQCTTSNDCRYANLDSYCHYGCWGPIVSTEHQQELEALSKEFSENFCTDCNTPQPCPEPSPPELVCVNGICEYE